ncbi:MAG: glycosyltransferase family 2 protein [Ruminococcus sp.]|jgi:glycosyltransferase involved in cell wall biosynthesis|nr:glycosyltransferase family 2 protein [Ruminococcus sp.]
MLISVIVPCYNEEEVLPFFHEKILEVTDGMTKKHGCEFEFLFVNDGSKDKTLLLLRKYNEADERFKYISFSRNFGKESAIYAGLQNAKGDYVVLLDADLQHPPERIPEMYEIVVGSGAGSGEVYDCAATRRVSRQGDSKILAFFSNSFYKINNKISNTDIKGGAQDFRFMTRQMVDAILSMSEYSRFSKGIFSWVGFNTKYIEVGNTARKAGKSNWNFWKLLSYSIDGFTGFSTAPLRLASILGTLTCIAAVVAAIVYLIRFIVTGETAGGFYTLMCTVLLFGGLQLLCIGILGEYLSKTYLETKRRPIYIVKESSILSKGQKHD